MITKERWQKLAGLSSEAESNEEPKTLQEGFENLGMAPVGVLGNPFGNRPKEPEYNLEGILEEMAPELESEKTNVVDDEGAMVKGQLEQMKLQAEQLLEKLSDDAKLESWVQSKLTLAAEMLDVVTHYLQDEDEDEQHDAHVEAHEDEEEKENKEDLDVDLEIVDDNDKDDKEND